MSLWKALGFVVVVGTLHGGATVGALAQDAVRGGAAPAALATLAEGQQPVPEPAPEAPVAAEPRESPASKPGRLPSPAKSAPRARTGSEVPPAPAAPLGERVNVRVDLKIRAQKGSSPPVEKTLALVTIGDNSRTAIRTGSSIPFNNGPKPDSGIHYQSLALNADARALVEGRRVAVELTLDFAFATQAREGEVEGRAAGTVTLSVQNVIRAVLEDGKPLVVSDQVDAASDYRVTVEAKATILR
jgi:hypothetical protein